MSLQDKLGAFRNNQLDTVKEEGRAFMEKNASEEGVQTLPSGIQYKVLQEGTGKQPELRNQVQAHYAGSLLNGKEFDSSYKRNQPFTAPLTALIKGWQEALPLMKEGSKWRLWIPSDLAYGDRGTGGIPGGSTLMFDVELLKVI